MIYSIRFDSIRGEAGDRTDDVQLRSRGTRCSYPDEVFIASKAGGVCVWERQRTTVEPQQRQRRQQLLLLLENVVSGEACICLSLSRPKVVAPPPQPIILGKSCKLP